MSAVKERKPTIYTVPALENLASRLSIGGDGSMEYFDKPPQQPGQIRTGDIAMLLADVSDPLQWMLFWCRYMLCPAAREHFLLWSDREIQSRNVEPEHASYLKHMAANSYCHGQKVSAQRIAKKLRVGRNNTAVKYVSALESVLYAASQSEQALGDKVRKRMK